MVSRLFSFFLFHLLLSISLLYPLFSPPVLSLEQCSRVCGADVLHHALARLHRDLWAKGRRNLFSMTFSHSAALMERTGEEGLMDIQEIGWSG